MTRLRRRTLLASAAGAAAVWACGRRKPEIDRRFVGPDPARGHVLRDRALSEPKVVDRIRTKVLIVGGGVSGHAAAWRLARSGFRDRWLVELEDGIGGTARHGSAPRSDYPMGAHYLPAPHRGQTQLRQLLQSIGVIRSISKTGEVQFDPTRVCRAPVERHKAQGQWFEGIYPAAGQSDADAEQWGRFRDHLRGLDAEVGSDGRRLFELPVRRSSAALRHLDRISMAAHLDDLGLTSDRLRFAVDYACRDDYGCTLTQTSAFAALHHYLCRGLEDHEDRPIITGARGNGYLVGRMAELAETAARTLPGTAVYRIDPDSGRVRAHRFADGTDVEFEADVVLWAAPRFVLPHVLPSGTDPLPRGALSYVPWLVANVEVARRPAGIGAPLSWDNVPVDGSNLGYVVANHLEPMTAAATPGAVLTYYEPLTGSTDDALRDQRAMLAGSGLHDLSERAVAALERIHPGIRSTVRRIDITRWGHAMVRPVPGMLFGPGLAQARAPIGRVLPCATDTAGLPLFEEAFHAGVEAASEAMARVGHTEIG